ncbi:MAG: ECF transporter S component [Lachnospiraceae bacterium]|nr:ECF transporter S component [Lachnospiraceae bacterium]
MKEKGFSIKKLVYASICLALCLVLPFLTGQMQQLGNALCPMHIPVLLCGFLCGAYYAAAVGAVAPLLRFALFGMPPIFPIGTAMCFELLAYGLIAGILYKRLPQKTINIYVSLLGAMLGGRLVWGIVRFAMALFFHVEFSLSMFVAGAFVTAVPGIICHIVLIPIIVMALEKAGFTIKEK